MQIIPAPGLKIEISRHAELFSVRVVGTSQWAACAAEELPGTLALMCFDEGAEIEATAARRWSRMVLSELTGAAD
jgi:hypothetical protein